MGHEQGSHRAPNSPDEWAILCKGLSEVLGKGRARSLGIREYVKKPIIAYDLARTIRQTLDGDGRTEET